MRLMIYSPANGNIRIDAQSVKRSSVSTSKAPPSNILGKGVVPPVPRNANSAIELASGHALVLKPL